MILFWNAFALVASLAPSLGLAVCVGQEQMVSSLHYHDHDARQLISGGELIANAMNRYTYFTRVPHAPDGLYSCGGSLIAPDIVLTSAACTNVSASGVFVGYQGGVSNTPTPVTAVFTHPQFDPHTLNYGFALFKLGSGSGAPFANHKIVRLADSAYSNAGAQPVVVGTGASSVLRQATVSPILSDQACQNTVHHPSGFPYYVSSSQFCAGDGVSGFCDEDWGGPLVIQAANASAAADDFDVQMGLAAWVFGCQDNNPRDGVDDPPGVPGVYNRISDAYEWIRSVVCQISVDAPDYLDCNSLISQMSFEGSSPPMVEPPLSPITFRYHIVNDGFLVELGIVVEKINEDGMSVELVQIVAPGALLPYIYDDSIDVIRELRLESGALYAFTLADAEEDGIDELDNTVNLFLETDAGQSRKIEGKTGSFGSRTSYIFYASIGVVQGAYYRRNIFQGGHEVRIVIEFDDSPWEIGLKLQSQRDGSIIWRNPPRHYGNPRQTVTERVALPDALDTYTLIVVDTGPAGQLLTTTTRVTVRDRGGGVLGTPLSVGNGGRENLTFLFDPAKITTAAPSRSPVSQEIGWGFPDDRLPQYETLSPTDSSGLENRWSTGCVSFWMSTASLLLAVGMDPWL